MPSRDGQSPSSGGVRRTATTQHPTAESGSAGSPDGSCAVLTLARRHALVLQVVIRLVGVHVVAVVVAAAAHGQHDAHRGHRKRDDDGSEHQCLRQRVGVVAEVAVHALLQYRRLAQHHAATGEDQQVGRVGQEGHAENHIEAARTQQQVDADRGQHADRGSQGQFHQCISPVRAERRCRSISPLRAVRVRDGLIVPIIDSISMAPPNTTR
ncbi:hypothetical protein G6F62_013043 [Rhizopus arrhizus]|nr:hypothetical protein G6F62_013043 [Rhizopus arrhizus]